MQNKHPYNNKKQNHKFNITQLLSIACKVIVHNNNYTGV